MEAMHMVETLRGQGTFVSADQEMLARMKEEMAQSILNYFISEMNALGYQGSDLIKMLQDYMQAKEAEDQ